MREVITIGLDIAKSVFQVHGVDLDGPVVIRKPVGRAKVVEFFGDCRESAASALSISAALMFRVSSGCLVAVLVRHSDAWSKISAKLSVQSCWSFKIIFCFCFQA
jgi:hypothetical protein